MQHAIWTRSWLDKIDLGLGDDPLDLLCDSIGAISLLEMTKEHNLTKHVNIQLHFVRNFVASWEVAIYPVRSSQNLANIMTKSLPKDKHQRIMSALGLDWQEQATRGSVIEDDSTRRS